MARMSMGLLMMAGDTRFIAPAFDDESKRTPLPIDITES